MKTAIYIEDGHMQMVFTPETDWEKKVLEDVKDGASLDVKRGSFYECNGGWHRRGTGDNSIILSVKDVKAPDFLKCPMHNVEGCACG